MTQTQPPPNTPIESSQPSPDLYSDPTIQRALEEDPLFRFLKRSWRELLIVIGAAGAIWYARGAFHETYETDMKRAGDALARAQQEALAVRRASDDYAKDTADLAALQAEQVASLPKVDPKAAPTKDAKDQSSKDPVEDRKNKLAAQELRVTEAKKRLDEGQQRLKGYVATLRDAREPYSQLSVMYAQIAGESVAASPLTPDAAKPGAASANFVQDLLVLSSARSALSVPEKRDEARRTLKTLASGTSLMATAAAVAFYRSATSAEEKQAATELIHELSERLPEQAELIKAELRGSAEG